MKLISILLFIVTLSLLGCGDSNIQGNAFVIKGGGNVVPAAGRTVYLIPEKSVHELLSHAINEVSPAILKNFKKTVRALCAPAKKTILVWDESNKFKMKGVDYSEKIPQSDCSTIQDEAWHLLTKFRNMSAQHSDKLSDMKSELAALKEKRNSTKDSKISELETALDKEKNAFRNSKIFKEYFLAKDNESDCNLTKHKRDKVNNYRDTVNRSRVAIDRFLAEINKCLDGNINAKPLYIALASVSKRTNSPFNIPNLDRLINSATRNQVVKAIVGEESRKTDTTINGLFKFNQVPRGEYLIYSDYNDSFVNGFWLTPITVKEDGQFDLNNNTFIDEPFDSYLARSIENIR